MLSGAIWALFWSILQKNYDQYFRNYFGFEYGWWVNHFEDTLPFSPESTLLTGFRQWASPTETKILNSKVNQNYQLLATSNHVITSLKYIIRQDVRNYETTSLPEYKVIVARILAVQNLRGGCTRPTSYAHGTAAARRSAVAVLTAARLYGIQKYIYDVLDRRVLKWGSMELQNCKISMETKNVMLWNKIFFKMGCTGTEI